VRGNCYVVLMAVFTGCLSVGTLLAYPPKDQKPKTVFLKIQGPEDSARQMRELLETAAQQDGLTLTPDGKGATVSLDITITEQKGKHQSARTEVISAKQSSADAAGETVYFCKSVSSNSRNSTTKVKYTRRIYPVPGATRKKVFIEKSKGDLSDIVKQKSSDKGLEIVPSESEADTKLTGFELIKKSVPLITRAQHVESRVSVDGARETFDTDLEFLQSIAEPIDSEAEICRPEIQSMLKDDPANKYQSVIVLYMYMINKQLNQ
jgi:hypothetical protein